MTGAAAGSRPKLTSLPLAAMRTVALVSLTSTAIHWYPAVRAAASLYFHRDDAAVIADFRSSEASPSDYVSSIDGALADDDTDLASSFVNLARERGVDLPSGTADRVAAATPYRITRFAREAWNGAVDGQADTPVAFVASLVSDMTVVGDARDLAHEISAYPDYNALTLALAASGIAATAVTYGSGLTAMPAKAGVSLLKTAEKTNRLTKGFRKELLSIAERSVNASELKAVARGARELKVAELASSARRVFRTEELIRLRTIATDLGHIAGGQGYRGTMQALEMAGSGEDLRKLSAVSAAKGSKFRAAMKFTGKAARLTLGIAEFLLSTLWLLLGCLAWFLGALWTAYRPLRYILGKAFGLLASGGREEVPSARVPRQQAERASDEGHPIDVAVPDGSRG